MPYVYICGLNSHLKCSFKIVLEIKHQNFSLRSPSFAVHEKLIKMPLHSKKLLLFARLHLKIYNISFDRNYYLKLPGFTEIFVIEKFQFLKYCYS